MIKKCPRGWSIFIGINIRRFERNQSPRASLSSLFGFKRVLECRLIKMEREFWLDLEREGTITMTYSHACFLPGVSVMF